MGGFACSSWYFLRFADPTYSEGPFNPDAVRHWLPVDLYVGGAEHAVMHLLYARFFVKAMRDMGVFSAAERAMREHGRDPSGAFDEPFLALRNQGQILGEERAGDKLVIEGTRDGELVVATSVKVDPAAVDGDGMVVGELMRRTENSLQVQTGSGLVAVKVERSTLGTTSRMTAKVSSAPSDLLVVQGWGGLPSWSIQGRGCRRDEFIRTCRKSLSSPLVSRRV